jgi:hypothetical protein
MWQCYDSSGGDVYHPATLLQADEEKLELDRRVDLQMRSAPLGAVGKLLAGVTKAEIFVPAGRIDERLDLYLDDASLDEMVRELGLMAVERP